MKMNKSMLAAAVAMVAVFASCRKDQLDAKPENLPADEQVSVASKMDNRPETESPVMKVVTNGVGNNISGYVAGLPARYDSTNKNYPLLIFIHGMGQLANSNSKLSSVLDLGTTKLLQQKQFPASFNVNGQNFSFIVVSPQFRDYPSANDVSALIDYMVENYRVDASRIYVSGLNMGGGAAWDVAGAFSSKVAAIVPITGASWADEKRCSNIAANGIGVWAFHNSEDKVIPSSISEQIVAKVNSFHPAKAAKLTLFNSAEHDAWTKATDPGYKENGMNIYEWMLQFSKSAK
jgi:predicted peptidase